MDVAGPRVFSWAMGIPSSEKTFWTVRMWAAGMASGGEIIRKSSKRWMRWGWRNCWIESSKRLLKACQRFLGYFCNRRLGGRQSNFFLPIVS